MGGGEDKGGVRFDTDSVEIPYCQVGATILTQAWTLQWHCKSPFGTPQIAAVSRIFPLPANRPLPGRQGRHSIHIVSCLD